MKLLLENWREYVNEVTSLNTELKDAIFQAIIESQFWKKSNYLKDVDIQPDLPGLDNKLGTPATLALQNNLNDMVNSLDLDLYFSVESSNEEYVLGPNDEYGGYPNNWMTLGQYKGPYQELDYKHVILIVIRPLSREYSLNDLDINTMVKKISTTINHELVHYRQLKKQAKNKGLSDIEAYREMVYDPKQIPTTDDRKTYLTRHGEIDAYAHEAAEQLIDAYGVQKSLKSIKNLSPVDIKKYPEISTVVLDYAEVLKDDPTELNKFRKKLYQQIQKQSVHKRSTMP
tara:strand:- start:1304 stop:2161 length:858 start_codon:yes stop_codon:yes gene_type:complete